MSIKDRLLVHLSQFPAAPFLFVGSGLSKRYVGLEAWRDMLRRFAAPLPKVFEYYASKADDNMPVLASLMAEAFHEIWWNSPEYEASRKEFSTTATKRDSPLKIEISRYVKDGLQVTEEAALKEELDALRQANIDGIITTNWDPVLESIFPEFKVFKSQDELLFSHPQSIAEIYKIHGCCTMPNSLVLTSEDYADFNARNPYLAAKLLTIFIEHPVIFLGYSLSDENIIGILTAIASCLKTENLAKLKDQLIFVQRAQGREDEISTTVLSLAGKFLPVTVVKTDAFVEVYGALQHNQRKFPAKMLRRLKDHIYELVKNNDPQGQMHVADIEKEDDNSRIQVVYGVGVAERLGQIGYRPIKIENLLEDAVLDNQNFIAEQVIRHTLPDLLQVSKNVPVFKYLREAGYFGEATKEIKKLPPKVQQAMKETPVTFAPKESAKKRKEVQALQCGIAQLIKHYDRNHCLLFIHLLDAARLDMEELGSFLRQHFADLMKVKNQRTQLRKLVCLYDLLKYGPRA